MRMFGQEAGPLSGPTTRLIPSPDELGEDELCHAVTQFDSAVQRAAVAAALGRVAYPHALHQLAQLDPRRRQNNLGRIIDRRHVVGHRCAYPSVRRGVCVVGGPVAGRPQQRRSRL